MSDVLRGGFLGAIVEHILRQPRWQILRYVAMIMGVGTGLAALYPNAPVSIPAWHAGGWIKILELSPERGAVRGVSWSTEFNCEDFVGDRPVERELVLEDLTSMSVIAPW